MVLACQAAAPFWAAAKLAATCWRAFARLFADSWAACVWLAAAARAYCWAFVTTETMPSIQLAHSGSRSASAKPAETCWGLRSSARVEADRAASAQRRALCGTAHLRV